MFISLLFLGCGDEIKTSPEPADDGNILLDNDGDGFFSDEDCDDNDSDTFPTAEEICDGYDNNCDGQADEDVLTTYYVDSDGDGFGNENITTMACDAPSGYITNASDCDDTNSETYPGAVEICDNQDNDCNAEVDDGIGQMFYVDSDGDGFGDENNQTEACDLSLGLSAVAGDCDDNNENIAPSGIEVCDEIDNNCDGEIDEGVASVFFLDEDEDGYGNPNVTVEGCEVPVGYVENMDDCHDTDTLINPDADEYCDTEDNDCDGIIDENLSVDAIVFYADEDEDGFGDLQNASFACSQPDGFVTNNTDCDDNNALVSPTGTEFCNNVDDNCDGAVDEIGAQNTNTYYWDSDNDGFGLENYSVQACTQPEDYAEDLGDCDDNDNDIHPDASEICDGIDNNCDQSIDGEDSIDLVTYYADEDNDGFGNGNVSQQLCSTPDGFVDNDDDCDDSLDTVAPNIEEICDGIDNNCDGKVDEQSGETFVVYYLDEDGDGYGDINTSLSACSIPDGYVENAEDCNDQESALNPSMDEVCGDGLDNNCDNLIDDSTSSNAILAYIDNDSDTYGTESIFVCEITEGYATQTGDCDDNDNDIHPDASEICDGIDNNCDQSIDGEDSIDLVTYYADEDNDGFGDENVSQQLCSTPDGFVDNDDDCDDSLDTVAPNKEEVCDGIDNDCDGNIDEQIGADLEIYYRDNDEDGFGDENDFLLACSLPEGYIDNNLDCDDSSDLIHPNADEICDEIDNNCNGITDGENAIDRGTFYFDGDNDGFGNENVSITSCSAPFSYIEVDVDNPQFDCNDTNNLQNPSQVELCSTDYNDDCDDETNESDAADVTTFYLDVDGDEYGIDGDTLQSCDAPDGYAPDGGDCEDDDIAINPGAIEVCDGIDNNCTDGIDEELSSSGFAEACAASSCSAIDGDEDGTYWIEDSGGSTEVYCELSASDGPKTWLFYDEVVAYWNFDSSSPQTDLIVGHTGSFTASSSSSMNSNFGNSVYFANDEGTRIDLSSGPSMGTEGTISFMAYNIGCSNNQIAFMFSDSSYMADFLYTARFIYSPVGAIFYNNNSACPDSNWKHHIVVYENTRVQTWYVNGSAVSADSVSGDHFDPNMTLTSMGSRSGFGTNGMNGYLDEVIWLNRPLSENEALNLYFQQMVNHRPLRY